MNWYIKVLQQSFDFQGRAQRAEYWFFTLISTIISFVLGFIDGFIGTVSMETGIGLLGGVYLLLILIPSIAVSVRRLHDTGRTGWWLLISLIPIIGAIVLIVFFVLDSQAEANQYGYNPKLKPEAVVVND